MKNVIELLKADSRISDYKINSHQKESCELFFVKGKLETFRRTNTCDKEVTVYADHGNYKGDAQFLIYASTTDDQLKELVADAAEKALLINNQHYTLPEAQQGEYTVESNFANYDMMELASIVAKTVFDANEIENGSLNSVEVFINKHTQTILNSRGLHKTQVKYDAMVEAIPTYNGEKQSVELYEQYNFAALDIPALSDQIRGKMAEVKARYEAAAPDFQMDCPVILNKLELAQLFMNIAYDLSYSSVYSHSNLYSKGDAIQKNPVQDKIGITMTGQIPGSVRSASFDADGLTLGSIRIVEDGKAVNYFGDNRYGQYLGEKPTGSLGCIRADVGTAPAEAFAEGLEVISMSGLQVDTYSDYIGGEVRLAYYHKDGKTVPITGISISGKLSQVLDHIRLSQETAVYNAYQGPAKAILSHMKIY